MKKEEHYRRLEQLYLGANVQQLFSGSTISVAHSKAEITLPVDPKYFHGAQAIHGATYFKLLDDAAYFAVASLVTDVFIVTASFQINLLRPVSGGTLKAAGIVRSVGKNLYVAEATLQNERGKEVAFGTGQFMRTNQPWTSLEHYRPGNQEEES
ncbi:PaaI family thioesterase [Pontibacter sp. JH31]|uniref:PaaI family thioesterase n=1 Tax=Pontibacter aquaedesilientis TaxID=2766980 RepID=A0ABR7XFX6_9BACT|nr:PaaI family thioesterase [Pontibacter aquaedesilientis]MBD1397204.1 PaaI family thioesterase [Pontibacter aquaedesilientis]